MVSSSFEMAGDEFKVWFTGMSLDVLESSPLW